MCIIPYICIHRTLRNHKLHQHVSWLHSTVYKEPSIIMIYIYKQSKTYSERRTLVWPASTSLDNLSDDIGGSSGGSGGWHVPRLIIYIYNSIIVIWKERLVAKDGWLTKDDTSKWYCRRRTTLVLAVVLLLQEKKDFVLLCKCRDQLIFLVQEGARNTEFCIDFIDCSYCSEYISLTETEERKGKIYTLCMM